MILLKILLSFNCDIFYNKLFRNFLIFFSKMADIPSWVKDAKLKNKQEIGFVKLINGKKSCESVLIDALWQMSQTSSSLTELEEKKKKEDALELNNFENTLCWRVEPAGLLFVTCHVFR